MTMQSRFNRLSDALYRVSVTDYKEIDLPTLEQLERDLWRAHKVAADTLYFRRNQLSTETVDK